MARQPEYKDYLSYKTADSFSLTPAEILAEKEDNDDRERKSLLIRRAMEDLSLPDQELIKVFYEKGVLLS